MLRQRYFESVIMPPSNKMTSLVESVQWTAGISSIENICKVYSTIKWCSDPSGGSRPQIGLLAAVQTEHSFSVSLFPHSWGTPLLHDADVSCPSAWLTGECRCWLSGSLLSLSRWHKNTLTMIPDWAEVQQQNTFSTIVLWCENLVYS